MFTREIWSNVQKCVYTNTTRIKYNSKTTTGGKKQNFDMSVVETIRYRVRALDRLFIIYEQCIKEKNRVYRYCYYKCARIHPKVTYSYMRIIYYSPVTIIAVKTRR